MKGRSTTTIYIWDHLFGYHFWRTDYNFGWQISSILSYTLQRVINHLSIQPSWKLTSTQGVHTTAEPKLFQGTLQYTYLMKHGKVHWTQSKGAKLTYSSPAVVNDSYQQGTILELIANGCNQCWHSPVYWWPSPVSVGGQLIYPLTYKQ